MKTADRDSVVQCLSRRETSGVLDSFNLIVLHLLEGSTMTVLDAELEADRLLDFEL